MKFATALNAPTARNVPSQFPQVPLTVISHDEREGQQVRKTYMMRPALQTKVDPNISSQLDEVSVDEDREEEDQNREFDP